MATQRKTILVIHPPTQDPADIRSMLGSIGHIAVTVTEEQAALKLLGAVRFDIILAGLVGHAERACKFIAQLRAQAPGSAVVGIAPREQNTANAAWQAQCDATVAEPVTASKMQWALDFELRYFGS